MPDGYVFQQKIDELFKGLFTVFHIADDILIAGLNVLDSTHDAALYRVLKYAERPTSRGTKTNASSGGPASPIQGKSYCSMLEKCSH